MEGKRQFSLGYLFWVVTVWAVAFAMTVPALRALNSPFKGVMILLAFPLASLSAAVYVIAIAMSLPLSQPEISLWMNTAWEVFKIGFLITISVFLGALFCQ